MIQVVALEEWQIDKLVELAQSYREDIESGSTVTDQPREDELREVDEIITALTNPDTVPLANWPDPDARPTY